MKSVAKELGKSEEYLRTPKGQEEAMTHLIKGYDKTLKENNEPLTDSNRYVVHQLGATRAKRYFTHTLTGKDYTIMWKNLPDETQAEIPRTDRVSILKAWKGLYNAS